MYIECCSTHKESKEFITVVMRKLMCVLTVTANEKRSNLPLNASSGLEALLPGNKNLTTAQQVLAQTMAQKVICHFRLFI